MSWKCKTYIWISWVKGREGKRIDSSWERGVLSMVRKGEGKWLEDLESRDLTKGEETLESRTARARLCQRASNRHVCKPDSWKEASSSYDSPKHRPILPREAGRAGEMHSELCAKDRISLTLRVSFADWQGLSLFLCCSHPYFPRFKWQTLMCMHTDNAQFPLQKSNLGEG